MKKTDPSIRIKIPRRKERGSVFGELLTAALISFGTAEMLVQAFPALPFSMWLTGAWMLAVAAAASFGRRTGLGELSSGIACLLLLAVGAVMLSPLKNGLCVLINDFLTWLPKKTGRITLPLETDGSQDMSFAALWATALFSVLLNGNAVTAMILLAVALCGTAAGFFLSSWGFAVFSFGMLLKILTLDKPKKTVTVLAALLLCAGLSAAVGLTQTDPAFRGDSLKAAIHSLRYDQPSNSMPEGQLRNLGRWDANDTPALSLTLEMPQKLYLRGFIGEKYTGEAWIPLDNETRADYADSFYWLHREDFYSQSSIGTLLQLTGLGETARMSVRNLSACSERLYLPYALCGNEFLDAALIGDATAVGRQTAELLYCPGSVPDWFGAQSALSVSQRGSAEQTYIGKEEQYRRFADENYRRIPAAAAETMEGLIGNSDSPRTLSEVKDTVLTVLETQLHYDASVITRSGDSDFFSYTLEHSRTGYSVHYATAAVLMLRYLGVDARYVEGYFLSAEEAAAYSAGEEIILTEENAHAWAEYYLDGVGWIPFETTPGYMDDEELNAGPGTGLQGERFYQQPQTEETEVVQPSEIRERTGIRNMFRIPRAVYAVGIPALLLTAAVLMLILKKLRLRKALEKIRRSEPREHVSALYGYAQVLLGYAGKQEPPGSGAAALNREALFSDHVISEEKVRDMENYVSRTLALCKNEWNPLQRFWYHVIRCIY